MVEASALLKKMQQQQNEVYFYKASREQVAMRRCITRASQLAHRIGRLILGFTAKILCSCTVVAFNSLLKLALGTVYSITWKVLNSIRT